MPCARHAPRCIPRGDRRDRARLPGAPAARGRAACGRAGRRAFRPARARPFGSGCTARRPTGRWSRAVRTTATRRGSRGRLGRRRSRAPAARRRTTTPRWSREAPARRAVARPIRSTSRARTRHRARDFAQALLGELDAPTRRVDRTLFQRWWRLSLVALVLLLVALGVRKLSLGPNLLGRQAVPAQLVLGGLLAATPAARRCCFTPITSSIPGSSSTWARPRRSTGSRSRTGRLLQRPRRPLVAETSTDRATWKELGRTRHGVLDLDAEVPAQDGPLPQAAGPRSHRRSISKTSRSADGRRPAGL